MRVVFTCDLHGRRHLYDKLLDSAVEYDSDCIIMGGDLFPTRISAPLKLLSGNADFNDSIRVQLEFIEGYLAPVLDAFMTKHPHIHLLYVPGNHDWKVSMDYFQEHLPRAVCMHNDVRRIDGVTFLGYGCVTDSPFWVKDYVRRDTPQSSHIESRYPLISTPDGICISEDAAYAYENPSIEEELSGLSLEDRNDAICIFHSPPFDTGLDTLHDGKPIGSLSIRRFIEENRPRISLHGHIHESPYMSGRYHTDICGTLSINPGHNGKELHAVYFDSSDPHASMVHSIFIKEPPRPSLLSSRIDRCARMVKACFMKTVLMK